MPMDLQTAANIAATISAMVDVITLGRESFSEYFRRREIDPSTIKIAESVQITFSTYSDAEISAIEKRIIRCRDRFIEEGSGEQRSGCLCSVLRDAKDGNGGDLSFFPEWDLYFTQLKC